MRELRRKLCAWESSGVKGTRAKLSAVGASAVSEDSASDVDSGPIFYFFSGGMDIHYTSATIATSIVCEVHHKP